MNVLNRTDAALGVDVMENAVDVAQIEIALLREMRQASKPHAVRSIMFPRVIQSVFAGIDSDDFGMLKLFCQMRRRRADAAPEIEDAANRKIRRQPGCETFNPAANEELLAFA